MSEPKTDPNPVPTEPCEHVSPEHVQDPHRPVAPGSTVQKDDIDVSMVAIVGAFFCVLTFICIVALQAWFYTFKNAEVDSAAKTAPQLEEMVALQQGKISRYDWADANKTVVRLPIDRAMELVAAEAKKQGRLNGVDDVRPSGVVY